MGRCGVECGEWWLRAPSMKGEVWRKSGLQEQRCWNGQFCSDLCLIWPFIGNDASGDHFHFRGEQNEGSDNWSYILLTPGRQAISQLCCLPVVSDLRKFTGLSWACLHKKDHGEAKGRCPMGKLCKRTLDTPTLLKLDTQHAESDWFLLVSEHTPPQLWCPTWPSTGLPIPNWASV